MEPVARGPRSGGVVSDDLRGGTTIQPACLDLQTPPKARSKAGGAAANGSPACADRREPGAAGSLGKSAYGCQVTVIAFVRLNCAPQGLVVGSRYQNW